MRRRLLLITLALALLAGGAFLWFSGNSGGAITVLKTDTVRKGQVRKQLDATGIVKAQVGAIVKIGAQATGRITSMRVKVGDAVTKGDLIAIIDDRELHATQTEATARLERTKAELDRVRTVYPLQITEAEADYAAAEAEADYAIQNLARQERLYAKNLIARDTLDSAVQSADVKGNQLRARKAALARLRKEFIKERRKAEKAVLEARANLDSIRTRLSYTRIKSPITGVVSKVTAQEGETVVSGLQVTNLITVLDPTRLEMWIYVDETDIGQVKQGMPVEFLVDAYPDTVFNGSIDQIYPEPEVRDNIVYYQALVTLGSDTALSLRPEMTTQCRIIVQTKDDVLSLPNSAIKWVSGEQAVYVVDKGETRRTSPTFGLAGSQRTEVLEGLSDGDTVATQLVLPGAKKKKASK
ncbi:efflux RND transporter periplasmic adaptor subunit [Desulfobaculum sp. SPO524]|uniref:efflux RND transporter periplasmic adaptor subunit n=1 Tax=Desulfobaculum sp. SPO524 TaxID=3378071 RepID=UPI003852E649